MLRRLVMCLFFLLLFAAADGRAQEVLPVPVFVRTLDTPSLPPLKAEIHEAEIKRTRDEMFKVAAQLRKEHGDKTKAWPPEVWSIFYDASDANTLAVARRDYQPPETRDGLSDSVEDVLRGAGGNKALTMVPSAAEASLIVQIIGRRRSSPRSPYDNHYFIRFRLAPGGKMTGARFLELTRDYKWEAPWSVLIAHAKESSQYVELEAGSPASYKTCAGILRAIVEGFVKARLDPAKKK